MAWIVHGVGLHARERWALSSAGTNEELTARAANAAGSKTNNAQILLPDSFTLILQGLAVPRIPLAQRLVIYTFGLARLL
jgi:hypothetical protein